MFQYCNNTKRKVSIHPATFKYGCTADKTVILPLEICTFHLPEGASPFVEMWDYGEDRGLQILVTPREAESEFQYYNDTKREVSIHSGTTFHDCTFDKSPIKHLETCTFRLPKGTYPFVKMWDYEEEGGLQILVMPLAEEF